MRPKKRILIWGATEQEASILRVVLESRRYAVEVAETEERLWQPDAPDVFLLVGFDDAQREDLERRVWLIHSRGPVVNVPARGIRSEALWITDLLNKVHLATCRKRGPKPGWKTAETVSAEVAA